MANFKDIHFYIFFNIYLNIYFQMCFYLKYPFIYFIGFKGWMLLQRRFAGQHILSYRLVYIHFIYILYTYLCYIHIYIDKFYTYTFIYFQRQFHPQFYLSFYSFDRRDAEMAKPLKFRGQIDQENYFKFFSGRRRGGKSRLE